VGWFGPRGLASIVFAVIVVETGVPHASTIVDATALTVTASIVVHGLSAGVLTESYARWLRQRPRHTGIEAAPTSVHVPVARFRWPWTPGR
jgi:NhaP-type Na+/H+ or K+/H+ antiporter